jgi:hypothetical protein
MTEFLDKSRALCYASISSADSYAKFFASAAGGAQSSDRPTMTRAVRKGASGYGMAIEDDGMVSGFTQISGPAELAGVVPGYRIVGVNGQAVSNKPQILEIVRRAAGNLEVDFTLEPPLASRSVTTNPFVQCTAIIKETTDSYNRDTRAAQETSLIKDIIDPLDEYLALLDKLKTDLAARETARDVYDRYRSKVQDLISSGSSRDANKLPRNEQKMAEAGEAFNKANMSAIAKLSSFHSQSVAFFGGINCAFLQHQSHLFSAGADTFRGLAEIMGGASDISGASYARMPHPHLSQPTAFLCAHHSASVSFSPLRCAVRCAVLYVRCTVRCAALRVLLCAAGSLADSGVPLTPTLPVISGAQRAQMIAFTLKQCRRRSA